ncbi:MAG: hypothetical protein WCC95_00415 [Candidatus Sulfotelmatobacter sp.]|jgi:hypothetical protein
MSDRQFIQKFESLAIPAEAFHHADHVHLAFAYLQEYPILQALEKFSAALKRFALAYDKPHLYNETITYAYVFLIHERIMRGEVRSWEEFATDNPDLLRWKGGILSRYYQESTLKCDLAKRIFVFPDKYLRPATSLLEVRSDRS